MKRKPQRLNRDNTMKLPQKGGAYALKNKYGTVIYIGRTNDLRHRISSYHQIDDFKAHPTKKALRKEATHFTYQEMPKKKRRAYEKKKKIGKKHNHV